MRVHLCYSGALNCNLNSLLGDSGEGKKISLPVPYQIIEHQQGLVVIDGGCAIEATKDDFEHWGHAAKFFSLKIKKEEYVVNKLKSLGFKVSDVKYVIQTHLHFDHSGALGVFPNATYIVRKSEFNCAKNPNFIVAGAYCQKDISKQQNNWLLLEDSHSELFDIFDDGLIRLLFTPGHTPGHQSILVNLKKFGKVLITGDAIHQRCSLEKNIAPPISLCCSAQDYSNSINKIRFYMNSGIKIYVGHDPQDLKDVQYLD